MLPETRSGRRRFAAILLLAVSTVLVLGLKALVPAYLPEAPGFRCHGPADAPVTIAVFSDFECGACRASVAPLKRIESMFPGKVRVLYKYRIFSFHHQSRLAAAAAECAGPQGRFWDFHDELFKRQAVWAQAKDSRELSILMLDLAGELKLDRGKFEACLAGPDAAEAVAADVREADEHRVQATPTFFINGKRFVGPRQLRTHGLNHIEDVLKG